MGSPGACCSRWRSRYSARSRLEAKPFFRSTLTACQVAGSSSSSCLAIVAGGAALAPRHVRRLGDDATTSAIAASCDPADEANAVSAGAIPVIVAGFAIDARVTGPGCPIAIAVAIPVGATAPGTATGRIAGAPCSEA